MSDTTSEGRVIDRVDMNSCIELCANFFVYLFVLIVILCL
jgi:hypothetical protein